MKTGIERINEERRRQIEVEGWNKLHDAVEHPTGELKTAATCYENAAYRLASGEDAPRPPEWPWADEWWKPGADADRCLEKAGALYLAEAERYEGAGKFWRAARMRGNVRRVECLLDQAMNVDLQEMIYETLWHFASIQRHGPFDHEQLEKDGDGNEVRVPANAGAAAAACGRIMRAFGLEPLPYGD